MVLEIIHTLGVTPQSSSSIDVSEGTYSLTVTDNNTGCFANDTITISEDAVPLSSISGGGNICG